MAKSMPHPLIYVPHGSIPDQRGFAPSIVAYQPTLHFARIKHLTFVSAREGEDSHHHNDGPRDIFRIRQSALYRRLFTKLTRLDPWPLDARLARISQRVGASLLHAHQLEFPVARWRRKTGLPVIVHAHVLDHSFRPELGLADRYIACSQYVKTHMVSHGYPEERIIVLENPLDTTLFRPLNDETAQHALRAQYAIPVTAPVLLFVGRKQTAKGYDTFLEVAERVLAHAPQAYVLAAGHTPDDAANEPHHAWRVACSARLASTGRFIDLPTRTQQQLAELYQLADVALLLSHIEAQGMVIAEAASSGCCIISARVGGIVDTLDNGRAGVLLDTPHDSNAAYAIVHHFLLAHPAAARALGAAAAISIHQRFDSRYYASQLEALYFDLSIPVNTP